MNNINSKLSDIDKLIKQCEQSSLSSFSYQDSMFAIGFCKVMGEADFAVNLNHKTNIEYVEENRLNSTEISLDEITATNISKDEMNEKEDIVTITSPFVGIVEFNDQIKSGNSGIRVNKGDILFSIEAMKIYNDVMAPVSGTIVGILVEDCSLVEYEQSIIKIRLGKDESYI